MIGEFVILRSRDQGVVCGYLKSLTTAPAGLGVAEVGDARKIHGWNKSDGGKELYTLFEASVRGLGSARISEPMSHATFTMFGVCGVYPCTPESEENLTQSRWNSPAKSSTSRRKPVAS